MTNIINTMAAIFRSTYGSEIELIDNETAIYHDALHALTGIGISIEEEVLLAAIENNLRGLLSLDMDLNERIYEALDLIPEEVLKELQEFYTR